MREFSPNHKTKNPAAEVSIPKTIASFSDNLPIGRARFLVLFILESGPISIHWFRVLAPAPIKAVPNNSKSNWKNVLESPIGRTNPRRELKTTVASRRGFDKDI